MTSRGFFCVLGGADAVGRGRVSSALADRLSTTRRVVLTGEPSTGPIGRLLRDVLERRTDIAADAMGPLFAADRADHIDLTIKPALANGSVVICDRYDLSNLAYRIAEAPTALFRCVVDECGWRGDEVGAEGSLFGGTECPRCGAYSAFLDMAPRERMRWARGLDRAPLRPDVTIVLDVPADVGAARRAQRGGAVELYDASATQRRVSALYRRAGELLPDRRVVVIDASVELECVVARAWAALSPAIGEA